MEFTLNCSNLHLKLLSSPITKEQREGGMKRRMQRRNFEHRVRRPLEAGTTSESGISTHTTAYYYLEHWTSTHGKV